jgi:hypothetical protein
MIMIHMDYGWIVFKFGMQLSIGFGIIENENRVTAK